MACVMAVCPCLADTPAHGGGSAASSAVVVFSTTGGFVWVSDRLTVYRDGRVTLQRSQGPIRELRLAQPQLEALEAKLAPVAQAGGLRSGPTAADGRGFSLKVDWEGKVTTLQWGEPTPIPPPVKPLVESLGRLEAQLRGK